MSLNPAPWIAALALTCAVAAPAAASTCTDLATAPIVLEAPAAVTAITAQDETTGSFTTPGGQTLTNLPPFCRVAMVIASSGNAATSQSRVEVWIPQGPGWNRRLEGFGNGGFAGAINYSELQLGVSEHFVAANTDLGTGLLFKCNGGFCGDHTGLGGIPGGLYNDPAAIQDFGYAATHLMTVAAKQLIATYFGGPQDHAYFNGCSTGGSQALMESQRFPDDYDGILAGAPAHNRTHLHMAGPAVYESTHAQADAYLTNAALGLIHGFVLRQCAGRDGGLRTDDFLTQPAMCTADAKALVCPGKPTDVPCTDHNAASCTCLTRHQAQAMDGVWTGAIDDLGRRMYPGGERGSEEPVPITPANGFAGNLGLPWQQAFSEPVFDGLMYWAQGPNWPWQSLFANTTTAQPELSAEIATIDNTPVGNTTFAATLNANSTDLSLFSTHGHRMIMYAGYADPLIPSATAIDYYNALAAADPSTDTYLRLFMAPGMWHCGSGPGANSFGNLTSTLPPRPLNAVDDVMGALLNWVERGGPGPRVIRATKYVGDNPAQGIAFQRPLCAYPSHAVYAGGDKTVFGSYSCVAGSPITNQSFSPAYGP